MKTISERLPALEALINKVECRTDAEVEIYVEEHRHEETGELLSIDGWSYIDNCDCSQHDEWLTEHGKDEELAVAACVAEITMETTKYVMDWYEEMKADLTKECGVK